MVILQAERPNPSLEATLHGLALGPRRAGVSQAVLKDGEELIDDARAQVAMARVKAYLESIGYEVEVFGL